MVQKRPMIVVHTNGIHKVKVLFCECAGPEGGYFGNVQLLQCSWFPTSGIRPRTAFTFECLEHFHHLTLQGKTTAWDYYNAIVHETDNTGLNLPAVHFFWLLLKSRSSHFPQRRYNELLIVMRWWRHLKMLKRAGRGHDPSGASGTPPGGLAVECPACPQPERNLPPWWKTVPRDVA